MSDLIKVPYSELFQRAARIRQEAETIRAERFFSLWNETIPEMERWVATLQGFAGELEEQARRMQLADESF